MNEAPGPPAFYAIADLEMLETPPRLEAAVAEMIEAGVGWVQLRAKKAPDDLFFALAETSCRRAEGTATRIWIDDRADLAALLPVFGVHVGQRDLPPGAARRSLGPGPRIGRSTHDEAQLREADADPDVDVIALGPIFPTRSKERPDPVVGLEELRRLRPLTAKPLVAIGGIDVSNIARVIEAGADSAAVLGAICRGDVAANCERLARALDQGVS